MIALVVVAGLGVCLMAASVMAPDLLGGLGPWPALAAGFIALVGALSALWMILRRRDRTLR